MRDDSRWVRAAGVQVMVVLNAQCPMPCVVALTRVERQLTGFVFALARSDIAAMAGISAAVSILVRDDR